jgi:endoglucanase
MPPSSRRTFIRKSTLLSAGLGLAASTPLPAQTLAPAPGNRVPRWRGFNLLDFFSHDPKQGRPTKAVYVDWIAEWGFDYIRIPISYPSYLKIDRSRPIRPDEVLNFDEARLAKVDALVQRCLKRGLHVTLNLHRVPGFCINAGFVEPYNLWKDAAAQEAFCAHWGMWAKRYRGLHLDRLSFGLVNEPYQRKDPNDQHSPGGPVDPADYRRVARAARDTIRAADATRMIIADGNGGGGMAVPELADLDLVQSCRGYHPFPISHYKASWVYKDPESVPPVDWPLKQGGKTLDIENLRSYYQPWKALLDRGVGVHCGECGCFNRTPHDVFLRWFGDVLTVLREMQVGFGLWEFSGTFGVLNSGRADVTYEDWHGEKLDRRLLDLLRRQA